MKTIMTIEEHIENIKQFLLDPLFQMDKYFETYEINEEQQKEIKKIISYSKEWQMRWLKELLDNSLKV